ncbi:MAG: phosphopentomutase [Clostridia bacterium]|nr:phosphopentomutase [Clostridia bacterium]
MAKRVFLVVLDSFGIGGAADAALFKDEGSNTLGAVCSDEDLNLPNLAKMGLFDINGHEDQRISEHLKKTSYQEPIGSYGRLIELSMGKDTTIGHWEIAGVLSDKPMPTYPDGFPQEILDKLKKATGREILCNKPYSGTEVINDYGDEHVKTGALIVYTSADSVLQIAAHEDVIPVPELYSICEKARAIMTGEHAVGRIIARPFIGTSGNYQRTSNRHDFSLTPPSSTMLDILKEKGKDVISVGKIVDIFASRGLTEFTRTSGNTEGIKVMFDMQKRDFDGLCFINLVDFDMLYGHRNDIKGYANALMEFDEALGKFIPDMRSDDLLIITADHGCDPSTPSTDHSRENVPVLIYGEGYNVPYNMGTKSGFNNIATIVLNSLLEDVSSFKYVPKTPSDNNIMSYVDMTNLKTNAKIEDIYGLIDRAIEADAASVCIQPCYVKEAYKYASGRLPICTVIGFPNGYHTPAVKLYEALEACENGAYEIDTVINNCMVKDGRFDEIYAELEALADGVHGKGCLLKVIIETCLLNEDEKIKLCDIVTRSGADYIKTSTGFGSAGATLEDVKLMKENVGPDVKVKAAGGIRTKDLAKEMISNGASRIGASNLS